MAEDRTIDNVTDKNAEEFGTEIVGTQRWITICKAINHDEAWFKTTKGMDVPSLGVLVQVTTNERGQIAEAITFVPGASLVVRRDGTAEIGWKR